MLELGGRLPAEKENMPAPAGGSKNGSEKPSEGSCRGICFGTVFCFCVSLLRIRAVFTGHGLFLLLPHQMLFCAAVRFCSDCLRNSGSNRTGKSKAVDIADPAIAQILRDLLPGKAHVLQEDLHSPTDSDPGKGQRDKDPVELIFFSPPKGKQAKKKPPRQFQVDCRGEGNEVMHV